MILFFLKILKKCMILTKKSAIRTDDTQNWNYADDMRKVADDLSAS